MAAHLQDISIPEATETERVLLGAILVDASQMLLVLEILPPSGGPWFYYEPHRLIYDAMLTLTERNDPIDLQTVTDVLRRRGNLEKVGGSVYLAEMLEQVVTTANVGYHARIIRDKAMYRALINISTSINAGAQEQEELSTLIHQSHEALMNLGNSQNQAHMSPLRDLIRDTIIRAQNGDDRDLTGVHTGFHHLNEATSGFQPGNLIILAGRPSQGKSVLAMQFAIAAARHQPTLPVVFFSLEMSKEELGSRALCSEGRLDAVRMRRGFFAQDEWGAAMDASERLYNLPILVDDTSSLSALDIRARAKRLQMEHGLGIIVIDYLQLMTASTRKENRQQEVSSISRDLKMLAKDLNIPIIALSQLNREVEGRSPPIPVLSDLRDSGSLEQDADLIMFVYRGDIHQKEEGGIAELLLLKQRNGPLARVPMLFHEAYARFDELNLTREHNMAGRGVVL